MQRCSKRQPAVANPRRARGVWLFLAGAVTALWSVGFAGAASAQYVTPEPPAAGVSADVQTSPVDAGSAAGGGATQAATRSSGQGLPVTGGDVVGMTAMGAGAVMVGGILVAIRRRSASA